MIPAAIGPAPLLVAPIGFVMTVADWKLLLPLTVNSIAEKSGFPVIARQRSISASAASKFGMMFRG